ncbi:ABC transporter substrate-binding protein [Hymenobacter sp. DG25B]|uniref:ABC transporter substrate-binding protein n=1 Tax=Hymenobacter sp. DG25B TaxID=1385664 RepID=UPI0009E249F7|nr:ABC transporter substrate-binding protein [Hymenobacter sp. DG25B]
MNRYLSTCGVVLLLLLGCRQQEAQRTYNVRIRWPRDPETLHPHTLANALAIQAINLTYQSLLAIDAPQQRIVPWLAEALPVVRRAGNTSYLTYRIRPAATWNDGQPITAQDIIFTLKTMRCPDLPNERMRATYGFVRSVQLDSTDTRQFTLVCDQFAPDYVLTSGDFAVLPEHLLDPGHQLRAFSLGRLDSVGATLPAVKQFVKEFSKARLEQSPGKYGSGPYVLKSWQSGQQLVFARKKPWWGDQVVPTPATFLARPNQISFHIIPDQTTALLALRRGDIDVYGSLPATDYQRLASSATDQKRIALYAPDSYEAVTVGFNTRKPALADSKTRQAISHLFDIPTLIKATQHGLAYPSASLISPHDKHYYNDSLAPVAYSPALATQLLAQAGWQQQPDKSWQRPSRSGPAQQLALTISYRAGDAAYEFIALQLRTVAGKVGIPINLRPTESSVLTQQLQAGAFDLYIRSLIGNPFAHNFLPLLHSGSTGTQGGNYTGFGSASSDALLTELAAAQDTVQKKQLLRKLQRVLQQQNPLTVLYFKRNPLAVSRRFTNLGLSGLPPGYEATRFTGHPQP